MEKSNESESIRERALDFVVRIAQSNPALLKTSFTLDNAIDEVLSISKKVENYLKG